MILLRMKKAAEVFLGTRVTHSVITVPASFNYSQCQATKYAGTLAGMNVLCLIKAPIAAAIAYDLHSIVYAQRTVLVFDLGGGSVDVTLSIIEEGIHELKATAGDIHLGGMDFDTRLVNHFIQEFKQRYEKGSSVKLQLLRIL